MLEDFWTMANAKRDFHRGFLSGFLIQSAPLSDGWIVLLLGSGVRGPLVDARDKNSRVFRSVDSAVKALKSVGFDVSTLRSF